MQKTYSLIRWQLGPRVLLLASFIPDYGYVGFWGQPADESSAAHKVSVKRLELFVSNSQPRA
jgi:hypothetical protein